MPSPWNIPSRVPQNITNRICKTLTDEDGNISTVDDQVSTYYSYDPHGNVTWLVQDIPALDGGSVRAGILIEYDYDLISGRVMGVRQQPGRFDQVLRKYDYDHDGRVISSSSSLDGWMWDRDAAYEYERHGPLRRIEYGEDSVQGADYAYTLNGWLKGVNVPTLSHTADLGDDGNASEGSNRTFGRDAFGMTLHYHDSDFVNSSSVFHNHSDDAPLRVRPLYNGNITGWAFNSRLTTTTTPPTAIAGRYRYDFLNRLIGDSIFNDATNGPWTSAGLNWATQYAYDPNGNITALRRYDEAGTDFDKLKYHYYDSPLSNKLEYLYDTNNVTTTHSNDLETQNAGNYTYDEIGHLLSDAAETITAITWTPSGKIDSIVKSTSRITYAYDAMGNRVRARVYNSSNVLQKTTWYVRDAQGTVLSIYEKDGSDSIRLKEVPLYGSDRVGMIKPNLGWKSAAKDTIDAVFNRYANQRSYELKDHLGNVRAVVSDEVTLESGPAYVPNVVSKTDYYPFGMAMAGRTENQADYRYGFNGKENDNDVKGAGNQEDYGFRIYDPRVSRFLSVDPLAGSYAWNSTYSFAENDVVRSIDLEGLERLVVVTHFGMGISVPLVRTEHANKVAEYIAMAEAGTRHPAAAIAVGEYQFGGTNISTIAGRITRHVAENGNMSTDEAFEGNAFRHGLWQAAITAKFGPKIAKQFGDGHEGIVPNQSSYVDFSLPLIQDQHAVDQVVDYLNNDIGRRIGARFNPESSQPEIAKEVLRVHRDEGLWSASKDKKGVFTISKKRITEGQYQKGLEQLSNIDTNGLSPKDKNDLEKTK